MPEPYPDAAYVVAFALAALWLLGGVASLALRRGRDAGASAFSSRLLPALLLWPLQRATPAATRAPDHLASTGNPPPLEALPATVRGTVGYHFHIDLHDGYDMVGFDEYEADQFLMRSELFQRLQIDRGKTISLRVEARDGAFVGSACMILWATDGNPVPS